MTRFRVSHSELVFIDIDIATLAMMLMVTGGNRKPGTLAYPLKLEILKDGQPIHSEELNDLEMII